MQLKIEKLVYGGDGLARLASDERGPGEAVFVPFVIDGETVDAMLVERKPGFARARLDRIIDSSPHRTQPRCPYFSRCGGCQYQHLNYQRQLKIKSGIVGETLKRIAKLDLPCELKVHGSAEWNYRNRTRLKVQTGPEFALGYYKLRSHELLAIEQCPISSPLINRIIDAIWALGHERKIPSELREIELFADHADGKLLIEAFCEPGTTRVNAQQAAEKLAQLAPEVEGVAVFESSRSDQVVEPKQLASSGATKLLYETELAKYRVSAGAFFQVNRFLIDELLATVTAGVSGRLAWDLYAGGGLFSTVLAKGFAQVMAVESSPTSYSDLRHNAPQEVKAVQATTEQYLSQASDISPDLVVADPPRAGLGENVIRSLAKLGAARMTYVSCDPSTLARDLRTFLGLGYRIVGAHLIDLFPQTYHIESVFHLDR